MTPNSPADSRHVSRRSVLQRGAIQFGACGVASVGLPEILRAKEAAVQAGRDYWASAGFCLMGGGGVQGGRIVGSTNRLGEVPKDRPVGPGDIHHTIYHALGVDPSTHFLDFAGRPVPAIDHGSVIRELF